MLRKQSLWIDVLYMSLSDGENRSFLSSTYEKLFKINYWKKCKFQDTLSFFFSVHIKGVSLGFRSGEPGTLKYIYVIYESL